MYSSGKKNKGCYARKDGVNVWILSYSVYPNGFDKTSSTILN